MEKVSPKVKYTILSMSLLTVMAGAAVAPALAAIHDHFCDCPGLLIKLIVSIPALFIILVTPLFPRLSRHFTSRQIALAGLLLYVVAGAGCFFATGIWPLLAMRAMLGVSVGLVMPLSTGLLSYYFPPEEQARLMGLSGAMNQLGGVVATILAGLLSVVGWRFAFLVYLVGLVAVAMVVAWLPAERLAAQEKGDGPSTLWLLRRFHPSVTGMLLLMMIFFIYPSNFAISAMRQGHVGPETVTLIMGGLDLVATFAGMAFGRAMKAFRVQMKYFAPVLFAAAYALFAVSHSLAPLIVGSVLGGIAMGVGVPYLNTIASIKGGRDSATTVMPLIAAALYLGQFVSPLVVSPLADFFFGEADVAAPYKIGVGLCAIFLVQVYATRHFQSLPPA